MYKLIKWFFSGLAIYAPIGLADTLSTPTPAPVYDVKGNIVQRMENEMQVQSIYSKDGKLVKESKAGGEVIDYGADGSKKSTSSNGASSK